MLKWFKSKKRKLDTISEITYYSNVEEMDNYYIVCIKHDLWVKNDDVNDLKFTKQIRDAYIYHDEISATVAAEHINGKVVRVIVVHYFDEL